MVAKVQFAEHPFDISYAAAQLAQFCASEGPSCWAVLTHLVGYFVHLPSFKLTYHKDSVGGLNGYTDSDRGSSLSCRLTTSLMARYNRCPVLWSSKMQKSVAFSSAEAEYYLASEMAIEII
jgi:hypothetical protein